MSATPSMQLHRGQTDKGPRGTGSNARGEGRAHSTRAIHGSGAAVTADAGRRNPCHPLHAFHWSILALPAQAAIATEKPENMIGGSGPCTRGEKNVAERWEIHTSSAATLQPHAPPPPNRSSRRRRTASASLASPAAAGCCCTTGCACSCWACWSCSRGGFCTVGWGAGAGCAAGASGAGAGCAAGAAGGAAGAGEGVGAVGAAAGAAGALVAATLAPAAAAACCCTCRAACWCALSDASCC